MSTRAPWLLLWTAALAPFSSAAVALQGERLRPPRFVTCDRNRLTAFTGRVTALSRGGDATSLEMLTDAETRESFRISHPGRDPLPWLFRSGRPFVAEDWDAILDGGKLRPETRATVWVCQDEANPKVEWITGSSRKRP